MTVEAGGRLSPGEEEGYYNPDGNPPPFSLPGLRSVGHLGAETEQILSDPKRLRQSHPLVYEAIAELQGAGNVVRAKWDAHKGTVLIIGSAVALGAVGGLAIRELRRKRRK